MSGRAVKFYTFEDKDVFTENLSVLDEIHETNIDNDKKSDEEFCTDGICYCYMDLEDL